MNAQSPAPPAPAPSSNGKGGPAESDATEVMVSFQGVRKNFGALQVLKGVDLAVDPGRIHALLGSNGAGKTTLIRILATLLRPDAGSVVFARLDVTTDPDAVRRAISLTSTCSSVC